MCIRGFCWPWLAGKYKSKKIWWKEYSTIRISRIGVDMNYPKLPSFRLDGKRALVTGAGRGIGMGASIALAESGANVTLVSRTEEELKDLTDHINNQGHKASY